MQYRGLPLERLLEVALRNPEAPVQGHLSQPRFPTDAAEPADAVDKARVCYAQAERLDVIEDLGYAVDRNSEHGHVDGDELRDGLVGEAESAEGVHDRAHVLVQVDQEGAWGAADRVSDVAVDADDAAEELDAWQEVLVEAAREEGRRSGKPPRLDVEGSEKIELGPEDPVRVEGEDRCLSADCLGNVRVSEVVAAEERADGVGLGGGVDAALAGGRGGGGEPAGDEVGDGGWAGLGDGDAREGS